MERPTCKTCAYLHDLEDDGMVLICQRNPPTINVDLIRAYQGDAAPKEKLDAGNWPVVLHDYWCGEHPDFPDYIKARAASLPPGSDPPHNSPEPVVGSPASTRSASAPER